ncbi:MAG: hypothetical protein EA427_04075 [Spirochaetaceae bacterium]|nr:MAG: hypothetical protein EA427_04075 [Spirochaetaceae bacterium]
MRGEIAAGVTVRRLAPAGRDEVLRVLVDAVVLDQGLDPEDVLEAVLERESSLSSRVSDRIAMPHAILPGMRSTLFGLGVCPEGINWDARDEDVQLVVLLVGPEDQHLPVMAAISRLLQAPGIVETILTAQSEDEVRRIFAGGDAAAVPLAGRTLSITATTVNHAVELARLLPLDPVVVSTSNAGIRSLLGALAEPPLAQRTFLVGPGLDRENSSPDEITVVSTDRFPEDPHGPAALTLLPLLTTGAIKPGSEVILLTGRSDQRGLDAVRLVDVSRELQIPEGLTDSHLPEGVRLDVVVRALHLTAEMGLQGREGKPIGTIIVIGDDPELDTHTQQMILNPFAGHPAPARNILDPSLGETVKELAKIDGAFIVSGQGTLMSVGAHLAGRPDPREMEAGLGARHAAALGITASADVLAICLSESTGTITLYFRGRRLIRR